MGQHDVLLMRRAQLVGRIPLGQIGDDAHLLGGGVARRAADRLERDRCRDMARHPVWIGVVGNPGGEAGIGGTQALEPGGVVARDKRRRREGGGDAGGLGLGCCDGGAVDLWK